MLVVLVTFAVLVPTALAGRDAAAPLVEVAEGRVLGVTETSTKGREFHSYYGIPFAKPPVGELRLQDPVQAERWEGVRDGSRTPSPCLLVPLAYAAMGVTLAPENLRGNEDCLYLNVFTPKTETSKNYPVMVWIHGGAYLAGGAYEYRPHVLMNHDIVLVVLQYRVGIMGFLSTEDEVIPGNFGLKDQTLALRWVQDNIHSFGGDADRVTIFGESAGGASVHYHILSPKSKGLFSRAIMQSGSALAPWARHEQHRRVAKEVSKAVGCSKAFGHKYEILDCLQEVDGRKLAARFQDFMEWFILPAVALPLVDGDFVPDLPARLMQVGAFNQVDLMAGITRDEGALVTNPMLARKDLFPALQNNFPVFGPVSLMVRPEIDDALVFSTKVYQHYLGNATIDRDHIKELTKMNTDYSFAVPHDLTTLYHARVPGLATYRYELKHRSQLSMGDFFKTNIGRQWISHGDDLYYLFAGGPLLNPSSLPSRPRDLQSEEDLRLRDIITTMWTNFAATGNPTPDDALGFKWEAATEDDLRYLALTPFPVMEADQRQEVRDFYASLPTKMNQIHYSDGGVYREESSCLVCQEDL